MATAIDCIIECCNNKQNFVLNGGAGSGKTYTLGQTLDHLYTKNLQIKIACITYTNVAKNEINGRFSQYGTIAFTIHEFLWNQIKFFQNDLKDTIIRLVAEGKIKYNSKNDKPPIREILKPNIDISYKDYEKLEEGIFSHDTLLKIAEAMFAQYSLLGRIIADRFEYIFIDEYQDTQKLTIQIFLDHIKTQPNKPVIGLFGDSMQAIYSTGIGDINSYIGSIVKDIPKDDNYRCSKQVINTINQLRLDDLKQKPAKDNSQGSTIFLYSTQKLSNETILKHCVFADWNLSPEHSRILYLTHRLIAVEMGFTKLFELYEDRLVGDDTLPKSIQHLLKLQDILELYRSDNVHKFLSKTAFTIANIEDKTTLKRHMDFLSSPEKAIEELIDYAHENNIIHKDDQFREYICQDEEHIDKYNKLRIIPVSELSNYYKYRNQSSPFSTQHSIKGAEFDNVLVIMDNGKWNLYNFNFLFEQTPDKMTIIQRTQKLFYVACSRAKNNLVVYFESPSDTALDKAREWFEEVIAI